MIDSCDILTLDKFIRCIEKQEYYVLGQGTEQQRFEAWEKIYDEFCRLTKNTKYLQSLKLAKEIAEMSAQCRAIDLCVNVLLIKNSSECKKILKKYGYDYHFDIDNIDQYIKDIEAVISKSKIILINLDAKRKEYERMKENSSEKSDFTFAENLAAISRWQGYRIDTKLTTVSEYAGILVMIEKSTKNGKR